MNNNDKAFAIYAFVLIGMLLTVLTIAVAGGIAAVPGVAFLVEHVALALTIRAAYKSFDGSNPVVDFLEFYGWKTPETSGVPDGMPAAA